jgi:hypothetical protein
MAADRGRDPKRVFPSKVYKLERKRTIKIPDAKVQFSEEKEILHHEGEHVTGPTKLKSFSGAGKASEMGKIFSAIKETYKP